MRRLNFFIIIVLFFNFTFVNLYAESEQKIYYTHTDHLGGTNVVTDEESSPIHILDYYPFGATRIDQSSSDYESSYKFTGKELDNETGLYYYGRRYYDSSIGRFISEDPLTFRLRGNNNTRTISNLIFEPQDFNTYSYCVNNPLKFIDPTGAFKLSTFGSAIWNGIESGLALGSAVNKALISGGMLATGNYSGAGIMFIGAIGSLDEASAKAVETITNAAYAFQDKDTFEGKISGMYSSLIEAYAGDVAVDLLQANKIATDIATLSESFKNLSNKAKNFNDAAAKIKDTDKLFRMWERYVIGAGAETAEFTTGAASTMIEIFDLFEPPQSSQEKE